MKKLEKQEYTVKPDGQVELKIITDILEDDGTLITSKNWRTGFDVGDWDEAKKYGLDKKLKEDWTTSVISARKKILEQAKK